ncbi:tmcA, partial [Symbiodinium microadriaticum]
AAEVVELRAAVPPRKLVVISGSPEWTERTGREVLRIMEAEALSSCGCKLKALVAQDFRADKPPPISEWMGQEIDAALLSVQRLNFLDTFGAVCGALRGGGVLVLCTPELEDWKASSAGGQWCREIEALSRKSDSPSFTCFLSQRTSEAEAFSLNLDSVMPVWRRSDQPDIVATADQQRVVEAVMQTSSASPLLISGRRGRGKSAALGLAATVLLRRGCEKILVTSPSRESTKQLFDSAERAARAVPTDLRVARRGPGCLEVGQVGSLRFVAIGELLGSKGQDLLRSCQYLFVDEAAGIPVAEAKRLLMRTRRVVMATTLDGYEGSGQGFLLRALPALRETKRDLRHLQLTAPLRWRSGCPLEHLSNKLLMLNAQPAPPAEVAGASSETVSFEHLQEDLSAEVNDRQLEQLFGLLRCSHYKTKPSDLRCFLETPNVRWYVLRHNSHVVGLGIVGIEEPILDARTAEAVYLRQMKVPPQLMAQTIASEAGFSEGVSYRFARVMRLCVHPAVQRRGLGSHLLRQMMQELREEDVDAVGAMFGLTPWLLQLWMREQTRLVWVAHGSDPSSGHHSATVLSAVSSRCDDLIDRLQARLALQLPDLLRDPLRELDANTLSGILAALPAPSPGQDAQDLADVRSYAWGSRNLSCCRYALVRASLDALRSSFRLSERHSRVLMDMLQGREVNESILRQAVRQLPWLTSDLAEEKTVNLVALRFLKYRPNRMSSVHKFSDEQTGKAALQGDDDGDDDDAGDDAGDGDDDDGHDGDDHGDDGHDGLGFHVVRHEQTDIMFFVFVLQLLDICVRYLPFGESTFLSEQILRNRPRLRQEGEFRRLGRAVRFEAQQPAD